ncbi:PspA/IM30 family protein [Candidatus Synechococcus calcipolaris G9]|uniref:PspA/IM30 family protein n=1 Tax=Candidatus Synechococcus calcipolaris G9 TaxID=1497997 RepID=A0ABT6F085_9SYNE|nr:PspA/IM30 family protein [Candidatus Synechococcus calcipolaris]MDG2991266.1 PspA/IM30 family protein [Candidatus Synechococcus calcipolaris G9]
MGLFDRISRVIRSYLNALVGSAEDPEKILDQTLIEMQDNLVQLRQAVAQAIASQKRLEQQFNQNEKQAHEWEGRAKLALQKGDEALALEALNRKQTATSAALALKGQLEQSLGQVKTLKTQMIALESKIAEAKTKKDMLVARARAAKASEQINQAIGKVGTNSSMAAFERMEDQVLQMEAQSQAVAELSTDSLEAKFAELESGGSAEAELAALKQQLSTPSAQLPEAAVAYDPELEALKRQLEQDS